MLFVSVPEVVQQVCRYLAMYGDHHLLSSLGCVVAGRLAYADPNLQVMLIEGI